MHGHLAAHLDPLGSEPPGDPALEPERLIPKLTPELQARVPAAVLRMYVTGDTLADALPRLSATYTGTIAYEIEHIADHEKRVWLRQAIESGKYRTQLSAEEKKELLARLSRVEAFEQYLRRAFLGQKQFSIEGLDVMVPMLDEAIELAAENGAHEVVIGMAHRGRLNVLAHTLGLGYDSILREFEGERTIEAVVATDEGGTGDVKYHLGAAGTRSTPAGEITVTLAANPSHLEAVDPVVEGRARAEQTDRSTRHGMHDPSVAMPVLIHGDASFPGQGGVAETLNLAALEGYSTGGTLHLIANNQVGFTTDPSEGRSTRYSSDLAKGFDVPIIHVNADDPEAAMSVVRLALAFRRRFESDVVVDLVGYRRHGHNEQDEAAYTQPLMTAQIAEHSDRSRAVRAAARRRGSRHPGGGRPAARAGHLGVEAGARGAEGDVRRAASGRGQDPVLERRRCGHGRCGRPVARAERRAAACARALHGSPEADGPAPAAAQDDRGRRHRLGPGRGSRLRVPARRGNPDQAYGSGHRARHVLAPPRRSPRRPDRRDVHAAAEPRRCNRVVRDLQLAALGVRLSRLRVRVLHCRAGSARALGGAVRRLRQRRADRDRPVHRRGTGEVARDDAADAAATPRLRRERPRAFERTAGTVPPARRAGEHPGRQSVDIGPALPSASTSGPRRSRPPARRDDAERTACG